ncbi:MAG: GIY-YIG nuclease family protein [Promethearchaeota archaeon]
MKPFGYIYLITNLINNKIYVGKTESIIKQRWYTHNWRANHIDRIENPIAIDLAIAKYGNNNFKIEKLDIAYSKEDLIRAEADLIKYYDSTNPNKGYNIDPMGEPTYSDDFKSIWEIQCESEADLLKRSKRRESLIKKTISLENEEDFKRDLKHLSGLQLEKKYGLFPNRRALLREIRRILNDDTIESIKEAKKILGVEYELEKKIPEENEDEFIEDFKELSGVELEHKYNMNRRALVRNIKRIFKESGSNLLNEIESLTDAKKAIGGKYFDINNLMNKIALEREQEFKKDVKNGITQQELSEKYQLGTSSFYRELKRICGVERLTDIREHSHYTPPIKKYISVEMEEEFIEDLKELSGLKLENKYRIPDRRLLLREIRRILKNETLESMKDIKLFIGAEVYDVLVQKSMMGKNSKKASYLREKQNSKVMLELV